MVPTSPYPMVLSALSTVAYTLRIATNMEPPLTVPMTEADRLSTVLVNFPAFKQSSSLRLPVPFTYATSPIKPPMRPTRALPPVFSSDAKAEIIEKGENSVKIRFPQASCDDTVQHYRCMLCKGEQVLKTEYRLSCSYLIPTPETLTVTFDELEAGEYTVKILAVSPWEKISEPLSFEFEV